MLLPSAPAGLGADSRKEVESSHLKAQSHYPECVPGLSGGSRSVFNERLLAEASTQPLQRGRGSSPGASGFVSGRIRGTSELEA